jgi:hypothetical protein
MAQIKFDGVIEAVRYSPGGLINMVRVYQRHGAVWSDHILLSRTELIQLLRNGKHFTTGLRKEYLGSTFETRLPVRLVEDHILTDGQAARLDLLAGVQLF